MCGVPLSRTGMVKTFIAFWAILLQILWLEKADFFFPSAAVGVSVHVSSELMSGYMRKKPKQPTGNLLPTRKFLQYYEPASPPPNLHLSESSVRWFVNFVQF